MFSLIPLETMVEGIRVRRNADGKVEMNLEDIARKLGIVERKEREDGTVREYVIWNRVKKYLVEIGIDLTSTALSNPDQVISNAESNGLPEYVLEVPVFWNLVSKVSNNLAKATKNHLLNVVAPAIRNYGVYATEEAQKRIQENVEKRFSEELAKKDEIINRQAELLHESGAFKSELGSRKDKRDKRPVYYVQWFDQVDKVRFDSKGNERHLYFTVHLYLKIKGVKYTVKQGHEISVSIENFCEYYGYEILRKELVLTYSTGEMCRIPEEALDAWYGDGIFDENHNLKLYTLGGMIAEKKSIAEKKLNANISVVDDLSAMTISRAYILSRAVADVEFSVEDKVVESPIADKVVESVESDLVTAETTASGFKVIRFKAKR